LIAAAAHALATGDPLGALKGIALRNDAPALALRGKAQLGDLVRAKALLRRTARRFWPERGCSSREVHAEAAIALASRDLSLPVGVRNPERHTGFTSLAHGALV
jgi:hypothetical protein